MVNSLGILCFPLAIKYIASREMGGSNLVDYMNVVGECVIWAACNVEIYFDLCAFPM